MRGGRALWLDARCQVRSWQLPLNQVREPAQSATPRNWWAMREMGFEGYLSRNTSEGKGLNVDRGLNRQRPKHNFRRGRQRKRVDAPGTVHFGANTIYR